MRYRVSTRDEADGQRTTRLETTRLHEAVLLFFDLAADYRYVSVETSHWEGPPFGWAGKRKIEDHGLTAGDEAGVPVVRTDERHSSADVRARNADRK